MKKLRREKIKLPVGSGNIFLSILLLIALVVVLTIVILYSPIVKKDNGSDKGSYGVDHEDVLLNNNLDCPSKVSKELIESSSKVKVIYSHTMVESEEKYLNIVADTEGYGEYISLELDAFLITVMNMPENTYAIITNDYDSSEEKFYYSSTINGEYEYTTLNVNDIIKYKISIRSDIDECKDQVIREFYFTLPILNINHFLGVCEGKEDEEKCGLLSYDAASGELFAPDEDDSSNDTGEDEPIIEPVKKFEIKFTVQNVIIISSTILLSIVLFLYVGIRLSNKRKKDQDEKM